MAEGKPRTILVAAPRTVHLPDSHERRSKRAYRAADPETSSRIASAKGYSRWEVRLRYLSTKQRGDTDGADDDGKAGGNSATAGRMPTGMEGGAGARARRGRERHGECGLTSSSTVYRGNTLPFITSAASVAAPRPAAPPPTPRLPGDDAKQGVRKRAQDRLNARAPCRSANGQLLQEMRPLEVELPLRGHDEIAGAGRGDPRRVEAVAPPSGLGVHSLQVGSDAPDRRGRQTEASQLRMPRVPVGQALESGLRQERLAPQRNQAPGV